MDEKIRQRCGKDNPFTVPEGYFDTLNGRILTSVDQAKRGKTVWVRWYTTVAAACIAGLILFNTQTSNTAKQTDDIVADTEFAFDDESVQMEVLNYSLMDNEDVYCYLSGIDY